MRIGHLSLSHFRSHKRTDLRFDGRCVAIWGPNGSGKTNLIEAISLLSPGRGLRRAAADAFARRPEAIGWRVVADILAHGREHRIELRAEGDAPRACRIDGRAEPQTALARHLRVLWLVPSMDRLWIEAAEGRRRFLDRVALSFLPGHAETSLAYERAMRERNRLLKDQVSDRRWYEALEASMARAGAEILANRLATLHRLEQAQADLGPAFPAASLALTGPIGAAPGPDGRLPDARDLGAALAAGRDADLRAGRTLAGPHRTDMEAVYLAKGTPADQCSTGEQKALLISLVLANARALMHDLREPPVLLLDEVAAHLDPGRREALYDTLHGLGAQAFLTGTDPVLFEALSGRAQTLTLADSPDGSLVRAA